MKRFGKAFIGTALSMYFLSPSSHAADLDLKAIKNYAKTRFNQTVAGGVTDPEFENGRLAIITDLKNDSLVKLGSLDRPDKNPVTGYTIHLLLAKVTVADDKTQTITAEPFDPSLECAGHELDVKYTVKDSNDVPPKKETTAEAACGGIFGVIGGDKIKISIDQDTASGAETDHATLDLVQDTPWPVYKSGSYVAVQVKTNAPPKPATGQLIMAVFIEANP